MAAALPLQQIDVPLLRCYHAIFALDTLLAIDRNSTLGALLPAWERFERGHFAGGRSIRTLADFHANYAYVLQLFQTNDFFREYHTRYRHHQRYRASLSAHAAFAQALIHLRTLEFVIAEDGFWYVTNMIQSFVNAHPVDRQQVGEEIRCYLDDSKPRMAFTDASSSVNRQLEFDDSEVLRYDTTSQENAHPQRLPAADAPAQHARLTLLLSQLAAQSQLAALHEP
jgi:hypothetical protein